MGVLRQAQKDGQSISLRPRIPEPTSNSVEHKIEELRTNWRVVMNLDEFRKTLTYIKINAQKTDAPKIIEVLKEVLRGAFKEMLPAGHGGTFKYSSLPNIVILALSELESRGVLTAQEVKDLLGAVENESQKS